MTIDAKTLRDLDAAATPAPWLFSSDVEHTCCYEAAIRAKDEKCATFMPLVAEGTIADMALITSIRNNLPDILARMERLEKVAVAARVVSSQRNGPYLMADMETTQHAEAELKQALSALDKP